MSRRPSKSRAFTLAEVLMASAVLAITVAAIAQAIVAGQTQTYEALHEGRGMALADALMEEILSLPYADPGGSSSPGPEAGESSRSLFDNCDDFHGYDEAAGAVSDVDGQAYPATYQRFSREATASYTTLSVSGLSNPVTGLSVTVIVTDDRGKQWTVTRFIAEPAP